MSSSALSYRQVLADTPPDLEVKEGWLAQLRRSAYERFRTLGFPTQKLEAWRYLDLEPVLGATFATDAKGFELPSRQEIEKYFVSKDEKNRAVFVNGIFSKELSKFEDLPREIVCTDLADALKNHEEKLKPYLAKNLNEDSNPFYAINTFSFRDGLFFFAPDKVVVSSPVHLLLLSVGDKPLVSYPRLLVVAGTNSRLRFTVTTASIGSGRHWLNAVSEIYLKPASCVEFSEVHHGDGAATRFVQNRFHVAKHANLEGFFFSEGQTSVRSEQWVDLAEENAFAELKGLGLLGGDSQVFQHWRVRHQAPHGTSRQFFKNILSGRARAEFNSFVEVAPGASKADSNQMNRNLLLSDSSRVFARPQLKILTDDVSCVHGSSTGQLQKEELFYLRSRGLSAPEARSILTYGFAEEVIETIGDEELRNQVETLLREQLEELVKC